MAPPPSSSNRRDCLHAGTLAALASLLPGLAAAATPSKGSSVSTNSSPSSPTLLQFDFPAKGPWGPALAQAMGALAQDIAAEEGLLWKIWTESEATGRAGGIYLFKDSASAERYREKHARRLQGFGIQGIVAHSFAVNEALTRVTRGPV